MSCRKLGFWALATLLATGCGGGGSTMMPVDAGRDIPVMDGGGGDTPAPDTPAPEDGTEKDDVPPPDDVPIEMEEERVPGVPTMGAGIALAPDDTLAVAANRDANSLSVFATNFATDPPTVTRRAEVPMGANSEPWSVIVSNNGNTAYAILRRAQRLVRISGLRTANPRITGLAATGSEPSGIALSPSGTRLFVTNFVDGTVGVYTTGLARIATVDLNAALASSGLLGTVAPRPGLAHPRAIVITNNGNRRDDDETVYVTEFFPQRIPTVNIGPAGENSDVTHQGVVYRFALTANFPVGPIIAIPPIANTGFQDSRNQNTGCFPSQLFAMKINNNRVFVSAMCESPRGPTGPAGMAPMVDTRNFKTQIFSIVAQIDTRTNAVMADRTVLLHQRFNDLFAMASTPAADQRFPLIPIDIAFSPMTNIGYVVSYGASAVFRVRYNDDGTVNEVGSSTQPVIRLNAGPMAQQGLDPYGIAIANNPARAAALVVNEFTRNVSVLNLATQNVVGAVESTANMPMDPVRRGRHFFVTGLGRWSLAGQGWNSCEACHPNGLTDNVTWYFPRGPRQTISLDAMHSKRDPRDQRILNWTAIFDEGADFELNTRGNSGGVGALVHTVSMPIGNGDRLAFDAAGGMAPTGVRVPQQGLNGSVRSLLSMAGFEGTRTVLQDWAELEAYMRTIRSPRGARGLRSADIAAGRELFRTGNCAGCHGGDKWTVSRVFYTPGEANNNPMMGALRMRSWTLPMGFPAARAPAPGTFRPPADRAAAHDQITCALRNVGTMPPAGMVETVGVLRGDQVELRQDMMTRGQGDATPQETGFNPPGLLGANVGGPYFHAGNARTLEELLSTTFQTHYQAFSSNFLATSGATRDMQVRQLVAFLISLDESTPAFPLAEARTRLGFEPDICASQMPAFP